MSDANTDNKLVYIRTNFGMWGVGCYWTLLELVAFQMKMPNPQPTATFSMAELTSFFGCKRNKLDSFVECLRNVCGMKCERSGNILKITIPKLLKIKDNYLKDLEETSGQLPSIELEEEREVEIEKIDRKMPRPNSLQDVEKLFVERSYSNPQKQSVEFWNYYEANGWKVGRNPMQDWKAAAAGWNSRSKQYGNVPTQNNPITKPQQWTCPDCKKSMPENKQYSHIDTCVKYRHGTPEQVKGFSASVEKLGKAWKG